MYGSVTSLEVKSLLLTQVWISFYSIRKEKKILPEQTMNRGIIGMLG
ncbi:MAG: hypothetical protein K2K56_10575 [Lachnospiraceae bacterium]|nr:hypothetical protein [Lachnospiraceae bacterium]